jgi:hypothetical protein
MDRANFVRANLWFLVLVVIFVAHPSSLAQTPKLNRSCKIDAKLLDMNHWFATTPAAKGEDYAISGERKAKILKNYSKVKIGMTSKDVEELLGAPDYEEAGFRNAGLRPDGTRDIDRCASQWGYYFKKSGENLADLTDSVLILSFNSERKLTWAAPQNIPQLSAKGSPID